MRKIFLSLLACVSVATFSCIDDKGNYEYGDLDGMMPVSITRFADLGYTAIETKLGESVTITPEVTGTEGGNYTYLWFAGKAPAGIDDTITLSTEFELKGNEILIPYGGFDSNVYVLKSGIIRGAYFNGFKEMTSAFGTPGTMIISYYAFIC